MNDPRIVEIWPSSPGHTLVQFTNGSWACSCDLREVRNNDNIYEPENTPNLRLREED